MLPSFPSLRERNLRTLYGNSKIISDYASSDVDDKSPKGCVDPKVRPLVDMINRHPDYVTLSSCSGRVALFDSDGGNFEERVGVGGGGGGGGNEDDDEEDSDSVGENREDETSTSEPLPLHTKRTNRKGTKISGKGRGKWIFVTHDVLPDLGKRIVRSLHAAGRQRLGSDHPPPPPITSIRKNTTIRKHQQQQQQQRLEPPPSSSSSSMSPITITFKHEPPLLHVAASSLAAGKKLLHLAKSTCAMRESGLVVTEQRVTVELRTTGTMLCLPLMVDIEPSTRCLREDDDKSTAAAAAAAATVLVPSEEYLMMLADMANERMVQNEVLLGKLFAVVRDELFEACTIDNSPMENQTSNTAITSDTEGGGKKYKVTLQPLPSLNLWKTAAVVIPRKNEAGTDHSDLDVLAFGGQGVGPCVEANAGVANGKAPASRRWDAVFRLTRRDGTWSDHWDVVPIASAEKWSDRSERETTVTTDAGTFRVRVCSSLGPREGHCACILPPSKNSAITAKMGSNCSSAVVLFGGRTGAPMSPSNDLFLFAPFQNEEEEEAGTLGRPLDVRGSPPEPRFGHSATVLRGSDRFDASSSHCGGPLVVVAGGTGVSTSSGGGAVSLSSVYVLSRGVDGGAGSELSHFVWGRVSEMPSPRSYHAAVMAPMEKDSNCMYVFGGVTNAGDPFESLGGTSREGRNSASGWLALPLFGKDTDARPVTDTSSLPPLVGSSAATITLKSDSVVLHVGGTKTPADSHLDNDVCRPLNILAFESDEDKMAKKVIRAQISSIELLVNGESKEAHSSDGIDFGSCVHHCLVTLPKERGIQSGDENASAITVGGGVPSFSFGQSYARSYFINVTREIAHNATSKNLQNQIKPRQQSKSPLVSNKSKSQLPAKIVDGKQTSKVQVNVIYVPANYAKEVKNELESLGFLDKRYKMIKVEKMPLDNADGGGDVMAHDGKCVGNLIAVPVMNQYIDQGVRTFTETAQQPKYSFEGLMVGRGVELVPFSSSAMGKMKQRKGLR